jgi:hypothetical protein
LRRRLRGSRSSPRCRPRGARTGVGGTGRRCRRCAPVSSGPGGCSRRRGCGRRRRHGRRSRGRAGLRARPGSRPRRLRRRSRRRPGRRRRRRRRRQRRRWPPRPCLGTRDRLRGRRLGGAGRAGRPFQRLLELSRHVGQDCGLGPFFRALGRRGRLGCAMGGRRPGARPRRLRARLRGRCDGSSAFRTAGRRGLGLERDHVRLQNRLAPDRRGRHRGADGGGGRQSRSVRHPGAFRLLRRDRSQRKRLHDGARRQRLREPFGLGAIMRGLGRRKTRPGDADDARLDDDVVRPADEKQMLDIVAAQQNQLSLLVEVVDVDDAEPGLPSPAGRTGQGRAASRQPPQDERKKRQEDEDDDERDRVMDRRRSFYAELGQQDVLSRMGRQAASTKQSFDTTATWVKGNRRRGRNRALRPRNRTGLTRH